MNEEDKLLRKLEELTDVLIPNEGSLLELDCDSDEYLELYESIEDTRVEIELTELRLGELEREAEK